MKLNEEKVPYARLTYSWDMILCIKDFIECVGIHKSDLKSSRNIDLIQFNIDFLNNKQFNPGGVLKDYIYLEANSFFDYAKQLKLSKTDKNMPDLPNYLKELGNFRDVMVGHRDRREKCVFPDGWIELQQKISKLIPVEKLIKDVDGYYQEVMKRHWSNYRKKFRI